MYTEDLFDATGDFLTAAIGWAGDIIETITSNPLLMIGLIMAIAGFGVGLVKRLINL